ncbi:MAG TPA: hypothetical protein VFY14_03260 [Streptomyces sp.]|nr:hypothetical protein [Streptomyces sp.]
MRDLFAPGHSEGKRRAEAERLIDELGGGARLRVVDVTQDVSPKAASARLGGSTDEGEYTGYVSLSEDDGWWVVPANTGEGAGRGPTAGTGRPSS